MRNDMIMEKSTERTAKMVKIISVKCPECNASISIEDNRKECFCQYCGTIVNDIINFTQSYIETLIVH